MCGMSRAVREVCEGLPEQRDDGGFGSGHAGSCERNLCDSSVIPQGDCSDASPGGVEFSSERLMSPFTGGARMQRMRSMTALERNRNGARARSGGPAASRESGCSFGATGRRFLNGLSISTAIFLERFCWGASGLSQADQWPGESCSPPVGDSRPAFFTAHSLNSSRIRRDIRDMRCW